jgi:hypothetical protein
LPSSRIRGWSYAFAAVFAFAALAAFAGSSPEQLQKELNDEFVGDWHYDDIPSGLADAKKTGRPVLVVFR